jgi:glycerol kinase
MVNNQLLMQFQADQLNVPVVRPKVAETTSLGAAYAAGLAVGFWDSFDALRANWQKEAEWVPSQDRSQPDQLFAGWKKAVTRTFDWIE